MKKIIGLSVAALLIVGVITGVTFAYFSDTESSVNNTLTAGVLDLNIDGGNIAVTTLNVSAAEPGASGSASSTLSNVGSMAGELDIETSVVTNTGAVSGTSEYADDSGDLGGVAQIAMYLDIDQSGGVTAGDIGLQSDGTTYDPTGGLDYDVVDNYASETWDAVIASMLASASDDIIILWQVPTTADNSIQGDSVEFDITFTLEQADVDP
jgi:predicted ribosomally synthesized peptide with SipW-like signal peptide